MRYFYDFEFVENGPDNPVLPLSLGMVAQDGRELYMQFPDYLKDALRNSWLRENVLPNLSDLRVADSLTGPRAFLCDHKRHLEDDGGDLSTCPWVYATYAHKFIMDFLRPDKYGKPELWGYYADYDHVVFCQLFGKMMDLPKGYPIWTRDLKQLAWMLGDPQMPKLTNAREHHALDDAREMSLRFDFLEQYSMGLKIGTVTQAVFGRMAP